MCTKPRPRGSRTIRAGSSAAAFLTAHAAGTSDKCDAPRDAPCTRSENARRNARILGDGPGGATPQATTFQDAGPDALDPLETETALPRRGVPSFSRIPGRLPGRISQSAGFPGSAWHPGVLQKPAGRGASGTPVP